MWALIKNKTIYKKGDSKMIALMYDLNTMKEKSFCEKYEFDSVTYISLYDLYKIDLANGTRLSMANISRSRKL